jgi:hypothetical protein
VTTSTADLLSKLTDDVLDQVSQDLAAACTRVQQGQTSGEDLYRVLHDTRQAIDAIRCWRFDVAGPRPAEPPATVT